METWELVLPASWRARVGRVHRDALGVVAGLLLAVPTAVALMTRDLSGTERLQAGFLLAIGLGVAAWSTLQVRRSWRSAAVGLVFLRVDPEAVHLRTRTGDWTSLRWADVLAVEVGLSHSPGSIVVRFVPVGGADGVLPFPVAHSDGIRDLITWIHAHRPEIPVRDRRPGPARPGASYGGEMDKIAIVGGHGQVARHLLVELRRTEHTPVALVRKEEYRDELEKRGAEVRLLDIEQQDSAAFAAAFEGCSAVVFAAGGGPDGDIDRKRTVDLEGSLKSIDGARQAGIARFVQISAIGVDDPLPDDTGDVWRAYVEAKRDADAALRDSGLDWTILRPGRLTDDPATGLVALGPDVERGDVTRADVAAVVAAVLDTDASIGQQWDLVGGDTSVREALQAAVV